MNIAEVDVNEAISDDDMLLIISGGDIKQIKREKVSDSTLPEKIAGLETNVEEIKKSVSDRNTKIATAITEKGVATEPTDSADVMAENIGKIQTGIGLTQVIGTTTTTSDCAVIKTIATHEPYIDIE